MQTRHIKRSHFSQFDNFSSATFSPPVLHLSLIFHLLPASLLLLFVLFFVRNNCPFPPSPSSSSCSSPSSTSASSATAAVTHLAHQNTRTGSLSRTRTFHVTQTCTQTPDTHTRACTVSPHVHTHTQTCIPPPKTCSHLHT